MYRLTKIGADGAALPDTATDHVAVQLDHPLLAKPIVWAAKRSPKAMTWKRAETYASKLDVGGWTWRLPTVEEAFLLPDRTKYPSLDVSFFPDFDADDYEWIWTGTQAAGLSGCAWDVYLNNGFSFRYSRTSEGFVRAVRAG